MKRGRTPSTVGSRWVYVSRFRAEDGGGVGVVEKRAAREQEGFGKARARKRDSRRGRKGQRKMWIDRKAEGQREKKGFGGG